MSGSILVSESFGQRSATSRMALSSESLKPSYEIVKNRRSKFCMNN